MTENVITCNESETLEHAAKLLIEEGITCLPIMNDQDYLVGIITQSDFLSKIVEVPHSMASIKQVFGQLHYFRSIEEMFENSKQIILKDVMSKKLKTVSYDTDLNSVVSYMMRKKLRRIPVLKDDRLVGLITRKNLVKAFLLS